MELGGRGGGVKSAEQLHIFQLINAIPYQNSIIFDNKIFTILHQSKTHIY